jgi:uncharacterized membrane-anchored protein
MNKLRLVIFVAVALAQITVPASMIWKRQQTLREGRLWKFRTAPVDPVDVFRGRYLTLRYEAEEFETSGPLPSGPFYVTLKEDADGYAIIDSVSDKVVDGDNVLQVENYGVYEGKARVGFSFDQFWVNEADAPAAERAYLAFSRGEQADAYVTVRIRGGDAAIEELYLNGKPLREFLRTMAEPAAR